MQVKSIFIPKLSSRIKILVIKDENKFNDEFNNITTEISELGYKSWVLESFVVGVNQIFNKWVLGTGADPNSIEALKEILYLEVLKLNPHLDPNNLYISEANNITLTKTQHKLITCDTWQVKTDSSNLILLGNTYEVSKTIENALNIEHYIVTDSWSFCEDLVYIRVYDKSKLSPLISGLNAKTEEELKYSIILCGIDNFPQIYELFAQDPSINHIINKLLDDLFYLVIKYNDFLDITLKDLIDTQKNLKSATTQDNLTSESKTDQKRKKLSDVSKEDILGLPATMLSKLFGQDKIIIEVCKTIKKAYLGIKNPKTPIGAFFFYGPTSTGKTELAKLLAKELTGSSLGLLKISCGTMAASHSVYTLIGAPPGYIGHENGGFIENAFKASKSTFKIILFDEIEKANSKIYDVILEMLEEGELMLANGTVLDISNCLVIFTSNMGQAEALKAASISGFSSERDDGGEEKQKRIAAQFEKTLKEELKPEFLARLNGIFYFKQLSLEDLYNVADVCLSNYFNILKEKNIIIVFNSDLLNYIVNTCKKTEKNLHARHIKNFVELVVLEKLGDFIIKAPINSEEQTISIELKNNEIFFNRI